MLKWVDMKKVTPVKKILISILATFTAMVAMKFFLDFRKELKRVKASAGFTPARFDLRDMGWASEARQQAWGTCWIFSTYSSLESNLLINNGWEKAGEKGPVDLAEYHMDKFNSFTRKGDDQHVKSDWYSGQGGNFPGGNHDDLNSGVVVHLGGDYRMATAILSNNRGAVQERLVPTIKGHSDQKIFGDTPWEGVLLENDYTYFIPKDVEYLTLFGSDENKREAIKKAIVRYGAVASTQNMDDTPVGITKEGMEIHMYRGKDKMNHAISLIGWDDDFKYKEHKGAWLVKDSDHKDEKTGKHIGYFWVLYDDVHVGKDPYMGGVSFRGVAKRTYDRAYTHAYHGWRYSTGDDGKVKSVATSFNLKDGEQVHSIGVYTTSLDVKVQLEIYSEINGVLLKKIEEEFYYPGFHRIDLKKPLDVGPKKKVFVVQKNSDNSYAYDASFTLDVLLSELPKWGEPVDINSKASLNESFYNDGRSWIDFASYKNSRNGQMLNKHAASSDTASVALNVYTVK
jgi:C1A family cysteine protease